MTDARPGLNPRRLVTLMRAAIARCELDLAGRTVLTEAATGAYVVTPVLAAMAGADVYALASPTEYASARNSPRQPSELADSAGVMGRVSLVTEKSPTVVGAADIVTNSGQVRPIDSSMIAYMRASSVVPLMYESWEFDTLTSTWMHATPAIFWWLGLMSDTNLSMCSRFLAPWLSRCYMTLESRSEEAAFWCYATIRSRHIIVGGLRSMGAEVTEASKLTEDALGAQCDAVLLATHPGAGCAFHRG